MRVRPIVKLLSIIVPVYNEEANVEPLYDAVNRTLERIADRYRWEFIFTDNCSRDRTFERLDRLAARDPRVRIYRFTRNFGFQRSILTGYRLARGDAAVQIDCDLQDPPDLILDFVRHWESGCKVVYGVRRSRPEPILLHAVRRFFYRAIAWLSTSRTAERVLRMRTAASGRLRLSAGRIIVRRFPIGSFVSST